ncbi:MAG: hypothetical protein Q7T41_01200 [Candidatus Saccharibacteria bacterium]|nr:hypothetical protein [Candidatus Saccharibacteria bacterium]
MAKFCPECPDRGECLGEIISAQVISSQTGGQTGYKADGTSFATFSIENGVPVGPTTLDVVFIDENNGLSNPTRHSGASYREATGAVDEHITAIEGCKGPIIKRRFFGLLKTTRCAID